MYHLIFGNGRPRPLVRPQVPYKQQFTGGNQRRRGSIILMRLDLDFSFLG